ncbi:GCN5-related N-acetyltransferase [Clostridium sp. DL-VIII]|uniref:GNAT family N-acetyltransferase n=1 Tax=Clostridium sp. DL-VIII TaxID=641107 RepID=UPI00023AFD7E|nr:GNAT family protein [Clostridium sp. DL-VIII]EHI99611.1 GCN5-related N-acetyltransferase [Clostridium sp. DL-VIII]
MLKGDNVTIRPIEKGDFELFYLWIQSQKCLGDFMDIDMVYKETFLENFEKSTKNATRFYAIIEDKDGNPIGEINSIEVIGSNTTLEIGLLIAEESSRGKGIGIECIRLFVNYLFKTKNIMRIQYITRTDNMRMKAIGEKTGFKIEGILKKYKFVDGDFRDFYLMAITRDYWKL